MSLTRDCFGRVATTHRCPECAAEFLGPAVCRPCPANGYAHAARAALPIVGCTPPPDKVFALALPIRVLAPTWEVAAEMGRRVVDEMFPRRIAERVRDRVLPVELETRADAIRRSTS